MPVKTLITSALPYANGPLHLGHMLEYVQTDIYVRFLKSCGENVTYVCADDTHGTPIELAASKAGLPPEQYVLRFFEEHQKDFAAFDVQFDCYWHTNSPENQKYSTQIYEKLKAAGDIDRRDVEQFYCEKDKRFLPDRFVRGTCPNCKAPDQYGDICEKCGKAYAPTELIDPRCAICGTPPVRKKSPHLFFKLSKHAEFLRGLIRDPAFLNTGLGKQLESFFEKGLADWDISRDGPYFGFPIPGEPGKFFYVWLDAPIGYIATTEKFASKSGRTALDWWAENADARVIHFIGKDIVYFHALFWPAVLKVAGFKRPSRINVHGHLTVNGEKMSKTRGTFINARPYLDLLDPSYLRFFYAANLGSGPEDLDLSLVEFRQRVNADLVNNIGNLANRTLTLLPEGKLTDGEIPGKQLVADAIARAGEVRKAFEALDYRVAVKTICEIAYAANQFLTVNEPWKKIKTDKEGARASLTAAADVVYLLAGLLQPVVPRLSANLFEQLNAPPLTYQQLASAKFPLLDRKRPIGKPSPLIARLEEAQVSKLIQAGQGAAAPEAAKSAPAAAPAPGPGGEIEYGDFEKVVLRVGKILSAERVPKADKLLKLSVDVGEGAPRTICAGIALAYPQAEALVGRNVVVVANLKPRTLKGIESRGMLLAAGPGGDKLSLVDPGPMAPGTEVK